MFKLNIRVLLAVSVALFFLYSLVNVASAVQARSLRSTLEALADPSKRQQGVVCQHFFCSDEETTRQCPAGCNSKLFFQIKIKTIKSQFIF